MAISLVEVVDTVANVAQTGIAGLCAWLAWKTFFKVDEQPSGDMGAVAQPDDDVDAVLIFETLKQKTWLKKTDGEIECYMDEKRKGKLSGRRWTLTRAEVKRILDTGDLHINPGYKIRTGLVSIGRHTNWLYTKKLFPDPDGLHHKIVELLKSVKV